MPDFDIKMTDNSPQYLAALHERIGVALEAAAVQAESHAKSIITREKRVDTGALRNSVTHSVSGDTAYIGSNLEYAVWNEIGTGRYASQGGGRQTAWFYIGRDGKKHRTVGMKPIHFLKRARITPAHAGRRARRRHNFRTSQDHPRTRGE